MTWTQKYGKDDNDLRDGDDNQHNDDKIYDVKYSGDYQGFKMCKYKNQNVNTILRNWSENCNILL
jgi:hypothetical protein